MSLTLKQINQWTKRLVVSALVYLLVGSGIILFLIKQKYLAHLFVFIEFCLLSLASIYFLSRLIADLIRVMTADEDSKIDFTVGAAIWGFLKFLTLGITIWRMIQTTDEFGLALALGVGTLFMVPMSSALMHKWKRI
ncbi:MAG: hypothetical protein KA715_01855 [Xanthomonadaceae bacterium]|nr:hypothetical protein [Xanthomonadaceae bacterium]